MTIMDNPKPKPQNFKIKGSQQWTFICTVCGNPVRKDEIHFGLHSNRICYITKVSGKDRK